jgi:hypothetical protein
MPVVATAATNAQKCEAKKNQIAGKYAACREKAVAKGIKKDEPPDFTKCVEKFDKLWDKAETKWGTECPTLGDANDIKQRVENCMLGVSSILACVSVAGSCWYLGQPGDSCETACSSLGLVIDPATGTFAAASADNCNGVLDALGDQNPDVVGPPGACLIGLGCHVIGGSTRTLCNSADDAASGAAERACACQ